MNIKLSHLGLNVSDMRRSLDFYTRVLGLKHAFSMKLNGNNWIEYLCIDDGQYIELFYEKPDREYSYSNGSFKHLCIETEDAKGYANLIRERGYEIWKEPIVGPDKNVQFWVKDPDGHQIEIMEMDKNSPQETFCREHKYKVYDFHIN